MSKNWSNAQWLAWQKKVIKEEAKEEIQDKYLASIKNSK